MATDKRNSHVLNYFDIDLENKDVEEVLEILGDREFSYRIPEFHESEE